MKSFAVFSFIFAVAVAPWLLLVAAPASAALFWVCLGLATAGTILLILDLVVFKRIHQSLGASINQATEKKSVSSRRLAYLLFVYMAPVSAVLGILACLR